MSFGVPSFATQKPAGATGGLQLIVTGEDAGNRPFRENVSVLSLQGRDCTYESRLRIEPGSSLMVEIPPDRAGVPSWRAAAIVEAITPVGPTQDLFQVSVVLGRAYEISTSAGAPPVQTQPNLAFAVNPRPTRPSGAAPARPEIEGSAKSGQLEQIASAMRPLIAQMVSEAVTLESERQMRELRASISQEVERAIQAPVAELTQYAKALPVINEQIIRQSVEQATDQQLMRTTALLQPAVAEMVREGVTAESGRQARELKSALSREIENAVQEPLAVMAHYAQSLPAIDEGTVRRLVGKAAETEFEQALVAIQPAIAEIMRAGIAAEYIRQTEELKTAIFAEVGKAVQGPVALQIAAMLDAALASRMAHDQRRTSGPANLNVAERGQLPSNAKIRDL